MLVSRREFLKLILGTAPAVALSGPLSALWPKEAKARPVAAPVTLFLDREYDSYHVFLVDDLDPEKPANEFFPPRREYFELETLSLKERVEFWRDGWGAAAHCEEFLWDAPEVEQWTSDDFATFNAFEAKQSAWLNARVDVDEMSDRDLASMNRFGPGYELYEVLGGEHADTLGLYEGFFGGPGGGGWAIAFRGEVKSLNAALAALGINVVVQDSLDEDRDDDDVLHEGESA